MKHFVVTFKRDRGFMGIVDRFTKTFFVEPLAHKYAAEVNGEVAVYDKPEPYYTHYFGNVFSDTDFTGIVNVGEIIVDAYKNTRRDCYALPDDVAAAKEAIARKNNAAHKTSNDYYAQPWV